MEWWQVIIIILAIWWIFKHYYNSLKSKKLINNSTPMEDEITEEVVFKRQLEFERAFEHALECHVPDAMDGQEIFIYRNLMSVWFTKLSGDNRYNDKIIQKIRKDWLDYMDALEDRNTYAFLALENMEEVEENGVDSYRSKHILASQKVFAIEDAFASMIGKEAVDKLAYIRGLTLFIDIDENGNLAPDGFEFDQGSKGKLRKKK